MWLNIRSQITRTRLILITNRFTINIILSRIITLLNIRSRSLFNRLCKLISLQNIIINSINQTNRQRMIIIRTYIQTIWRRIKRNLIKTIYTFSILFNSTIISNTKIRRSTKIFMKYTINNLLLINSIKSTRNRLRRK